MKDGFQKYSDIVKKWMKTDGFNHLKKLDDSNPTTADDEIFFDKFFKKYEGITSSYNTLLLSGKFIKCHPPRLQGVDKGDYLNYIIHTFLNDVYILQERLILYATTITRLYRKRLTPRTQKELEEYSHRIVKDSLKSIVVGARGKHVHESRFHPIELNNLSMATLAYNLDPSLKHIHDATYIVVRRSWSLKIDLINKDIMKHVLNPFFGLLYEVVTNGEELVRPPKAYRTRKPKSSTVERSARSATD